MDSLLVAGDHLLVVVVDVLRGGAGAPAGGHHVPAVLSGGPDLTARHVKHEIFSGSRS